MCLFPPNLSQMNFQAHMDLFGKITSESMKDIRKEHYHRLLS